MAERLCRQRLDGPSHPAPPTPPPLDGPWVLAHFRSQAHSMGLGVGLKNDMDQLAQLEPLFDYFVNE